MVKELLSLGSWAVLSDGTSVVGEGRAPGVSE